MLRGGTGAGTGWDAATATARSELVIPSMMASWDASSATVGPASTEWAAIKQRKIDPLPISDSTSIRPDCSSQRPGGSEGGVRD